MVNYTVFIKNYFEHIKDDEKNTLSVLISQTPRKEIDLDINFCVEQLLKFNKIKLKLYLSNLLLENLPENLFKLTNLDTLHIDGNRLKFLSPNIGNLTNLQELKMSGNFKEPMIDEILKLKKLKILETDMIISESFCSIEIERLDACSIKLSTLLKLKNLKTVNLDFLIFDRKPIFMCDLLQLETLYVGYKPFDFKKKKRLICKLLILMYKSFNKLNYKIISKLLKY